METELARLTVRMRRFMEPVWLRWHQAWQAVDGDAIPDVPSRFTCGRTSLFVCRVLQAKGYDAAWVNGVPRLKEDGPDEGPYGFWDGRRWQSHAWVECAGWIIDITADQFGAHPVIVVPVDDHRYGKHLNDTALPMFVAAREQTVLDIWPEWSAFERQDA